MAKLDKIRGSGPERKIQDRIIPFLQARGWFVKETHGNMYQKGFPDLWATHKSFGERWIEVKYAPAYSFTEAQLRDFPMICAHGSGVWIMVDATESEYSCLMRTPNWYIYLLLLNQRGTSKCQVPKELKDLLLSEAPEVLETPKLITPQVAIPQAPINSALAKNLDLLRRM